jgi:hypothetical protein
MTLSSPESVCKAPVSSLTRDTISGVDAIQGSVFGPQAFAPDSKKGAFPITYLSFD